MLEMIETYRTLLVSVNRSIWLTFNKVSVFNYGVRVEKSSVSFSNFIYYRVINACRLQ